MDEKLTLNDGTELNGHLIETEERIFLYIYNKTLVEVVELLTDPEKTSVISWNRYGQTGEVRGYQTLMSVSVERSDMTSASLRR